MSDAPTITDTLTYPTITNETSPHFAEALGLEDIPEPGDRLSGTGSRPSANV
jgi:hypothetical protein